MTHPANMTSQERLALAERLRRDDCTAADRESASDLIVRQEVEWNDLLKALRR